MKPRRRIAHVAGGAVCAGCSSHYYANSAPAVEGLLERDGRVLSLTAEEFARDVIAPLRG